MFIPVDVPTNRQLPQKAAGENRAEVADIQRHNSKHSGLNQLA